MSSLRKTQSEFVRDVAKLIEYCYTHGVEITFGEANRPFEMQLLYFYGYTIEQKNDSIVLVKTTPKSKTLDSKHLKRLAIDLNFFINGRLVYDKAKLQHIGDYWESLNPNNKWGGNFKSFTDTPHFQRNL